MQGGVVPFSPVPPYTRHCIGGIGDRLEQKCPFWSGTLLSLCVSSFTQKAFRQHSIGLPNSRRGVFPAARIPIQHDAKRGSCRSPTIPVSQVMGNHFVIPTNWHHQTSRGTC